MFNKDGGVMAVKKCKKCGTEVSTEAVKCPKCGARQWKSTPFGIWFAVGIFALVAYQCSTMIDERERRDAAKEMAKAKEAAKEAAKTPEEKAADIREREISYLKDDAKVKCRKFVEYTLKAPATAEFPSYSDFHAASVGGGRYGVVGYVDAQNSFGAKIRTQFACTLQNTGNTWKLVELKTSP